MWNRTKRMWAFELERKVARLNKLVNAAFMRK